MAVLGAGSSIGGLGGSAVISRLLVVISGTTAPLDAALAGAKGGLQGFNAGAARLGSALTRSVTLPMLGLGGVSLKLASDFNTAMGRVAGLTTIAGKSGYSIDELSTKLLNLAQVVPTAPTELANSLYYAGSAGLSASQAMKVVELSAKGAAIGMGSAADISKVLIFALNNYAKEGLTASHAMDVLTEGIKRGTAEPEEMAIALGRVLPVAQDAGIAFDTVVASIAALTNIGLPTRVATTSLRALFTELLAPTIQATEKLDQLGVSSEELRDTLKAGPIAAFQLLLKATHGNVDALHDIIPQIRGFTAFSGLSGEKLKTYAKTINAVTHSTGALNKAFKIISKTPAFQFEIGLNKLRVAGIQIGQKLIPVFLKFVQVIGDVGDALANMPGWAQTALVAIGLLAASMGPLLKLWGNLVASGQGLFSTGKSVAIGLTTMALAATAAVGGFSALARGSESLFSMLTTFVGTAASVGLALSGIAKLANTGALGVNALSVALASMSGGTILAVAAAIGAVAVVVGSIIGKSHEASNAVKSLSDSFVAASQTAKTFGDMVDQALEGAKASDAVKEYIRNLAAAIDISSKGKAPLQDLHQLFLLSAQSAASAGDQLLALYTQLRAGDGAIGDFDEQIRNAVSALDEFAFFSKKGKTVDLDKIFAGKGTNIDEVTQMLETLKSQAGVGTAAGQEFGSLADNLILLTQAADSSGKMYSKLRTITLAQITATQLHDQSVEKLASHFGVSTEFMDQKLQAYGTTAEGVLGSGGKVVKAFGTAAGLIKGSTGEIIGAQAEAAAQIEARSQEIADALAGSFSIFDKAPEAIKQDTDKIVSHVQSMAQLMLREAENIRTLGARGVPSGLIEQLIGQGPAMVQKFVDSSRPQLRRLITAYEITLAATDAAILREGAHQATKGKGMVQGFVGAILGSRNLPVAAAHKIVNAMTPAFQSGKAKPAGVKFIVDFSKAIGASGAPKASAGKAVLAAVEQLKKNHGEAPAGHKKITQFAQGIASASGIPVAKVRSIITRVSGALNSAAAGASGAGHRVASNFAAGIRAGTGEAVAAAQALAAQTKAALDGALRGSPNYFSYYMGHELGNQLHQGLKESAGDLAVRHHHDYRGGPTRFARPGVGHKPQSSKMVMIEGTIEIDGLEGRVRGLAREEAISELAYRE